MEHGSLLLPGRQMCYFTFASWPFPAEEGRAWEESNAQFFLCCCALCSTWQSWLAKRSLSYPLAPSRMFWAQSSSCSTLPTAQFSQIDTMQFLMPNSYSKNAFLILAGKIINTALPSQSHYPPVQL